MLGLLALNKLTPTDIIFFVALAVIIVIAVAIYFLIPVFNKKQYKEQRENLHKREISFKSNIKRTDGKMSVGEDVMAQETPPEADAEEQRGDNTPAD